MSHGSVHHAEDPLLPRVAVLTHLQTQPRLVLGQGEAPAPHQVMSRVTCHVSRSPARGGVSEPVPAVAPALVAAAPRPVAPHHPHLPRPVTRPRVQAAANPIRDVPSSVSTNHSSPVVPAQLPGAGQQPQLGAAPTLTRPHPRPLVVVQLTASNTLFLIIYIYKKSQHEKSLVVVVGGEFR